MTLRSGVVVRVREVTASEGIHMTIVKVLVIIRGIALTVDPGDVSEGRWKGNERFLRGNGLDDAVAASVFLMNWSVYGFLAELHWKCRIVLGKGDGYCTERSPGVKDCDGCSRSTDDSRRVNIVFDLCWEQSAAEPDCLVELDCEVDYEAEPECLVLAGEAYLSIVEEYMRLEDID